MMVISRHDLCYKAAWSINRSHTPTLYTLLDTFSFSMLLVTQKSCTHTHVPWGPSQWRFCQRTIESAGRRELECGWPALVATQKNCGHIHFSTYIIRMKQIPTTENHNRQLTAENGAGMHMVQQRCWSGRG